MSGGGSRLLRLVALGTTVTGALLVALSAGIHLHLWQIGYRNVPTIGPLFMFQVVAGFLIAAVILATRHPLATLVGAVFMASTIGGLLLSAWVGLFGFHDSFDAPFAGVSLFVEGAGVVVLLAATVLGVVQRRARRHTRSSSVPMRGEAGSPLSGVG